MIKGQPFSLNYSSNPSFTLSAGNIELATFASIVIANRGPGACAVYPSGSASGPPIEIVGTNQRKYIMLGGVDTICMALVPPITNSVLSVNAQFDYGFQLYAALAACDDYSLTGTPDYARGAFLALTAGVNANGILQATDIGFDRFRGIMIPPQANPPEIFAPSSPNAIPMISESGMSIAVSQSSIYIATSLAYTLFLADNEMIAGGAGGGTYG